MRFRIRHAALVALAATLPAAVAAAPPVEVHANAGFDFDIAGVVLGDAPPGGFIAWSPLDLANATVSGALRVAGPAGLYRLTACVHPDAVVPFGVYAYEFGITARAASEAWLWAEVVPMFGGDSPETDGPCNRPWTGYASTGGRFTGPATFHARIARQNADPDTYLMLVLHKGVGDVLIDDWSLVLEANPLAVDGFE